MISNRTVVRVFNNGVVECVQRAGNPFPIQSFLNGTRSLCRWSNNYGFLLFHMFIFVTSCFICRYLPNGRLDLTPVSRTRADLDPIARLMDWSVVGSYSRALTTLLATTL